jgi:hypothetical protein
VWPFLSAGTALLCCLPTHLSSQPLDEPTLTPSRAYWVNLPLSPDLLPFLVRSTIVLLLPAWDQRQGLPVTYSMLRVAINPDFLSLLLLAHET